jgi:hypothetical protein
MASTLESPDRSPVALVELLPA